MSHCFVVNISNKVLMITKCGRVSVSACECVSKVKVKASPATIMVIIFWDFLMFDQIFLSPQVKRSVIISNKHGINKLILHLRFTPCKAQQKLWGMALQEKEVQKDWSIEEICFERTYSWKVCENYRLKTLYIIDRGTAFCRQRTPEPGCERKERVHIDILKNLGMVTEKSSNLSE